MMLSGPPVHYKEYMDYLTGTQFKHDQFNPEGKRPDCTYPTIEAVFISISSLIIHLSFAKYFPVEELLKPNGLAEMNLFMRHIYGVLSICGIRCKYYFIWKLSEGAGILAGLGFGGYDKNGNPLWNRLTNIYISKIETFGCLRDITTYWNYKTAEWLKHYFYLRQTRDPNKDKIPAYALYLTNTLSAFWHGFYPGYYFTFVYAAIFIDIARRIRTIFRPYVTEGQGKDEKKIYPIYYVYDILGRFFGMWIFTFGFQGFAGLSVANTIIGYSNLGWSGVILIFGSVLIFNFFPRRNQPLLQKLDKIN
jgi:lysophospholipid acyltransferase